MLPKKNSSKTLEKHRGLFFLIGLAAALGLAVMALQYKTTSTLAKATDADTAVVENSGIDIPITILNWPKPEIKRKVNYTLEPKTEPKTEPKPEPVDPPTKLNPNLGTPIGSFDPGLEEIETVEVMFLEKIARPYSCEDFSSKEEQLLCLNQWIQQFIQKNVRYPEVSKTMRSEEKIYLSLIISELGGLEKAEVVRGEDPALREEALRVANKLPQFIPATQQGNPVKMRFTIPVTFKLQ